MAARQLFTLSALGVTSLGGFWLIWAGGPVFGSPPPGARGQPLSFWLPSPPSGAELISVSGKLFQTTVQRTYITVAPQA